MESVEKNKGGRPTKYEPKFNDQVRKLCLLGADDKEIADFFEVEESTINNWKLAYPKFLESIKKGKIIADSEVSERLYERAIGFEHDSEEIKVINDSIERVPIRKIYPPDTAAAIFWLKNRKRAYWKDKQDIEHTSPQGISITIGKDEANEPLAE